MKFTAYVIHHEFAASGDPDKTIVANITNMKKMAFTTVQIAPIILNILPS
jgi:hypothetical protein